MEGYSQCFAALLGLPYLVGVGQFLVRGPRTDPVIAVSLNILLPGLGYAYLGRWVRFLVAAGPILLLLASNLSADLRAVVEPARLAISRSLSFGASTIHPVLVIALWLAQILDAARIAKRGRSRESPQSKAGETADGQREQPDG